MKPHPYFRDRSMPTVHPLGPFVLKALTVDDVERDFLAVMQSAADIKAMHPGSSWPDGLTRHENLLDLAWHQREFECRRSFAWIVEDAGGDYLGCLYVYPSIAGLAAADVKWWWRTGPDAPKATFPALLRDWLSSVDWPRLDYVFQNG